MGRARHDLPGGGHGCRRGRRRRAGAARRLRGRRLGGTRGTGRRTLASGIPRRAGCASPLDRRWWRARQDDHGGHDRVRPSRARSRPRVDHRRSRATARRKRRHGRGLARGRGRRVRPLDRPSRGRDRRRDEHRARPSCDIRLGGRAVGVLRALARAGALGRARLGARARRPAALGAGRPQPHECRRRARRARARGCRARGGRIASSSGSRESAGGSSSSANEAACA